MPGEIAESQRSAAAQSRWRRSNRTDRGAREVTFPVVIARAAERSGAAPALLSEQETLRNAALAERAGQFAASVRSQLLAPGEVVCLMMPHCPEYPTI